MVAERWGLAGLINRAQTSFVGLLRVWSIPIVVMLSVASGYTTYYGMSHFITWWIALIITIAVQSIIVISSLEIAGIHWKANRTRYLAVLLSLLIAVAASVSFSYFKFYEISEEKNIQLRHLADLRHAVEGYLDDVLQVSRKLVAEQREKTGAAAEEANLAYLGTHPEVTPRYRNQVGRGPFWRHYNQLYLREKERQQMLEQAAEALAQQVHALRQRVAQLTSDTTSQTIYEQVASDLIGVQSAFDGLVRDDERAVRSAPVLEPYAAFVQGVTPSFAMWQAFSLFAFVCAAMVDFFTILLSYRLEFTAPGPLSEREQDMVYACLSQFSQLRINRNDELEIVIEKSPIEQARRYSDWSRMFGVAFLLSRGYLRKVGNRAVEFAPNLYPVIAGRLTPKLNPMGGPPRARADETGSGLPQGAADGK
jgi:hypothetical protein